MKKLYLSVIGALLFAAIMVSNTGCKLDKPVIPDSLLNNVPAEGKFSAKINGTLRTAPISTATYFPGADTRNAVNVFGSLGEFEGIQISVENAKVGTFHSDGSLSSVIIYSADSRISDEVYMSTDDGTITITTFNDKVIKGTFSGTVETFFTNGTTLTKAITEGKFECQLTVLK